MIVHLNETIWAEGTATELGIFTGTYVVACMSNLNIMKTENEKQRVLAEALAKVKSIQIHKEGESADENH